MEKTRVFRKTAAASVLGVALATAQVPANAQTSTAGFLESCRSLAASSGTVSGKASTCHNILEGTIAALGLLTKEYYPISAKLGYCLEPGIKPKKVAGTIVGFADKNPECGTLSTFTMCINMALQASYPNSC